MKKAKKKKPAAEPRAAAPAEMPGPDEVVKTPDLPTGGASEEQLDEEIEAVESIGDGTEEGDDMPPEVDDEDDEVYF